MGICQAMCKHPLDTGTPHILPHVPCCCLGIINFPLPLQVFLSSLRSPLQLTNPDRGLLFATGSDRCLIWATCFDRDLLKAAGSLLVFYVTPQLFRPFMSPLFSFTGPLPSSRVPSYLSWSPSIFTGPVLSFTGPLPSSWVLSYLSRSPSIFTGPVLSFTDPLQFLQVPFHFQGSPPLLHGSPSVFMVPVG